MPPGRPSDPQRACSPFFCPQLQQAFAIQASPASTPAQIKEATVWLEKFQNTSEAWQVADQLLAQPAENGQPRAEHIFAAQTMRTKILYDWAELPAEAHASLRQSLLAHVVRFGHGPQPVLTQLCLAVGVLALHMEEWHATVVNDLITSLTTPPEEAAAKLPCLLQLLQILPEEAENYKVNVLPRRRDNFRNMLKASTQSVLGLLHQVCSQFQPQVGSSPAADSVLTKAMHCLVPWMRHVGLATEQLVNLPVLPFSFTALAHAPLFDAAADLIVETIHFTADCAQNEALVPQLIPSVLQLAPLYEASVAAEDEEASKAFCRIFVEAGEQFLPVLLRNTAEWALPMAALILRGARHPEPEVAEITFNFWYVLSEQLAGGGKMLSPESRPEVCASFAPLFLELVDALRVLVELPEESDRWSADASDDFKRFRYAVGDAIFDSCKVSTSVAVIGKLFATLKAKLPDFAADPPGQWRAIEGCVYCLRQSISTNDPTFFRSEAVAELLQLLPTLPAVGQLQPTAIRTVGTYANWLSRNPQLLMTMLSFVSSGITSEATAAAASQAMKHLCDACAEHLAQSETMAQLLQMYHSTLSLRLSPADRVDLIAALSFVVSQMELHHILPAMEAIAAPHLERLRQMLGSPTPAPSAEVALALEQVCALLRGVSPSRGGIDEQLASGALGHHPSVAMLLQIWDVLNGVFARHGTSSNCMEKLCRCYKHTSRNCGEAFREIVPKLLPQVTGWYEAEPHSCFLYINNVCLSGFGIGPRAADLLPVFTDAFRRMSHKTFALLGGSAESLVDNPDVVDDYFELCGKVLRHQPQMLLEAADLLDLSYECGCAALHLQHREAGRSALRFFENFVDLVSRPGRDPHRPLPEASLNALRALLGARGAQLVGRIVGAISGQLPASRVRLFAPLLKMLIEVEPPPHATCNAWATQAIQQLHAEMHADGQVFVGALFSPEALSNERIFVAAADAFSDACRRRRVQAAA